MSRIDEDALSRAIIDLGVAADGFDVLAMHTQQTCEHEALVRFMADLLQMYYHRLEAAAGLAPPARSGPRLVDNGGET